MYLVCIFSIIRERTFSLFPCESVGVSCPLPDLSGDVAESGDATVGLCAEGGDADLLELLGGWPLAKDGF